MNRKSIASAALLAALASGGAAGLIGFGNSASAATDSSSTTAAATSTAADSTTATAATAGPHQANGITETPLTGDDLAKATAAAATAAPGSTVVRAETDADGDVYEVHITNADGTNATVKLNADFTVKAVEAGGSGRGGKGGGAHGTETALTGDDLAKATAAAAAAEPGSTLVRAETDADGDAYEVHITKADGTKATVKLNADFTVRTVEAGATK